MKQGWLVVLSMKPFLALILTIVLAYDSALAGIDGLVYCVEKDTGESSRIPTQNTKGVEEGCCPFELAGNIPHPPVPYECDHCVDFEVDTSDEGLNSRLDRIIFNASAICKWISEKPFTANNELYVLKNVSARAPPYQYNASQQYVDTIVFRI